MEKSIKNERN